MESALQSQLAAAQSELTSAQSEIERLDANLSRVREQLDRQSTESASREDAQMASSSQLKDQMTKMQVKIHQKKKSYLFLPCFQRKISTFFSLFPIQFFLQGTIEHGRTREKLRGF